MRNRARNGEGRASVFVIVPIWGRDTEDRLDLARRQADRMAMWLSRNGYEPRTQFDAMKGTGHIGDMMGAWVRTALASDRFVMGEGWRECAMARGLRRLLCEVGHPEWGDR